MKLPIAFAVGLLTLALTPAKAQQMSPAQCAELRDMISRTESGVRQAEGASSQQGYLKQALAQYRALYAARCAR